MMNDAYLIFKKIQTLTHEATPLLIEKGEIAKISFLDKSSLLIHEQLLHWENKDFNNKIDTLYTLSEVIDILNETLEVELTINDILEV